MCVDVYRTTATGGGGGGNPIAVKKYIIYQNSFKIVTV
jgi:hypothetical protein